VSGTTSGPLGNVERKRAEDVFLKLLGELAAAGIRVGNSPQGNYAPKEMSRSPDRQGFSKRDFEAAMRNLIAQKRIRLEQAGRRMAFVACEPPEPANPFDFNQASEAA
jgi:hypothetical protein